MSVNMLLFGLFSETEAKLENPLWLAYINTYVVWQNI